MPESRLASHLLPHPHWTPCRASFCRTLAGICHMVTPCRHAARSWVSTSCWENREFSARTDYGHHECRAVCQPPCWPITPRTVHPP